MAELGEQVERSSAILGASTKSVQEFGFIAKATGGDAEGLSMAMGHLQVNLQQAASGTGRAYQALKALGLSAKELSSLTLDQQLDRIANAFAKFGDGPNKTAIAIELLGRAGAQMIPVLDQGSEGLNELRASADNTGAVLSKSAVESLSALNRSLVGLKAAVSGAAGALAAEFAPALTRAVAGTAELIGSVNTAIQTGTVWEREIIAISTGARELGQVMANLGTMAKDVFTFKWGDVDANWAKIAADRQAGLDRVAAIQKEGDDKILGIAKQAAVDLQKILGGEEGPTKPQAPSSAMPNTSDIAARMEQFQTQIKLYDQAYKQTQEILAGEVKLHQITYDQETQLLLQALDRRHTEELAALNAELQISGLTAAQYQKLVDQKLLLDQKYQAAHDKLVIAEAEKDAQAWQSVLTPIHSAWDSQLKGLLSGTETWGTAMKRIFQDLVMDAIKRLEALAVEQAAMGLKNLTMSATGGAGGSPMSLISSLFSGASGAASQTASVTLQAGATTLAAGATTLQVAATTLQTAAMTMSAGGAGAPLSILPDLASLDVGAWSVPHDMVAMVHQGEMIAPNDGSASTLRGMLSGGGGAGGAAAARGGDTHLHIHTVDASSFQSWLTRGGTLQIMRAIAGASLLYPSLT